jgi:hypothetical protein
MRTETTATEPWIDRAEGLEEARALLRPRFESREHWTFVVDVWATAVIDRIFSKYYQGAPTEDFAVISGVVNGDKFAVVTARKNRMLAWQLNSLLRQIARVRLSDREAAARDLHIITDPARLDNGTKLAAALFDDPEAERGDPGDVMTLDGRLAVAE